MKVIPGRTYSNEDILDGIIRGDPAIFRYVSGHSLPFLLKYLGKEGNKRQAEEIIQDAFVIIFRKLSTSGIDLKCQFLTFFIAICKRIRNYEKMLVERKETFREVPVEFIELNDQELEMLWMESREFRIYRYHFGKLKVKQQQILEASLNGFPYRDLYLEFGFGSVEAFKNEVYRIKNNLYRRIMTDPEYRQLLNRNKWSFDD